jgi:2-hydroxycyclohexanecarboxyl-CoA dehydrogenase
MRLDGKTAMITGGVSWIGKATVLEFARYGAKEICADINVETGAEFEKEVAAQKLPIEYVKIDMADRGTVRSCAAQVLERPGMSIFWSMPRA